MMPEGLLMKIGFWGALWLMGFTFGGYHVLMLWLARRQKNLTPNPPSQNLPTVSFVLVVADESNRIAARVQNLMAAEYPAEKMEVIVVTDGSSDGTPAKVKALMAADSRIRCLELGTRMGKANGLNQGVAAASGEIIVFADARQRFAPDTVKRLVQVLADERTGAVSGRLVVDGAASAVGQGVGSYWSMEVRLRTAESQFDSCIGCTGAVYAVRRKLFQPIPADTWLDDVVIPMQIALQGQRVQYDPEALAYDPQDLDHDREKVRKKRTLGGNFQMLFRYPGWLLPWVNRLWFQLIAHKYLRLAGPFLVLFIWGSNAMLRQEAFYGFCFWLQNSFYLCALIGLLQPKLKFKLFALPAAFVFLNWMVLLGLRHYLTAPKTGAWETVKRH